VPKRCLALAFLFAIAGPLLSVTEAQLAPLPVDTIKAARPQAKHARFIVAPYGWMVGISAETGVRDLAATLDISFSDLVRHLNFGFMGTAEGAYGPWLGIVDGVYASLGAERTLSRGRVQPELDFKIKLLISQAFVGYTVKPAPEVDVDIFAGSRLWAVRSTLDVATQAASTERSKSPTWADAIGGGRVRWRVTPQWQFTVSGDGGAGGSKATGEGMAGLNYDLSKHWSLFGSFRYLYENYHKNDYFFTGHLSGPVLGGSYRW
jgi:hypothetical protein